MIKTKVKIAAGRKPKRVFRSNFESKGLEDLKGFDFEYEPKDGKLTYTIPETKHLYTPDYVIKGTNLIIEYKGLFDNSDRNKQLLLKKQHPDKTVIIVFQNPRLKIYKGSPTTVAMWCDKNGITWTTRENLKTTILLKLHEKKTKKPQ